MIVLTCGSCLLVARVMGDVRQVDFLVGKNSQFWPDKYTCPRCGETALATLLANTPTEVLTRKDVLHLEAEELFASLNGLGLPEERTATKEAVEELLVNNRVVGVGGDTYRSGRCQINWLDLDDGTRMFFAAGGRGAVVYRIRKRHSYVEKEDGEANARI